jgi:ABC-type transport system involved in multi-copper enzyme maturation permease subunit
MLWTLVRRSLSRHRALIFGLGGLLSGFQFLLVVVATNYQRQGLFAQAAALVPAFVQEALGGMILASFAGTVALGFFHPVVMLALSCGAIYLASEPAGEVEHGLVDLVAARPVPRHLLMTRSLIVSAGGIGAIVVLMFTANELAVRLIAPSGVVLIARARLVWVAANLLTVVWCLGAAGLAIGARATRRGAAAGAMALIAVFLYLLHFAAAAWTKLRPAARISPFHYYESMPTLLGTSLPVRNMVGLLFATAVLFVIGQVVYARRDL